jgi:hypothetical protein
MMIETKNADALVEAALDNYPLAPLPPGFVRATMARLTPPIRFRFYFLDLALPFGFTLLLLPLFGLYLWLRGVITLAWLPVPALPAAPFATISWPTLFFLLILAEITLLLAGLASVAWWDEGMVLRET